MAQLHVKMHLMHTEPEKLFGLELAPNLEHIIPNSSTKVWNNKENWNMNVSGEFFLKKYHQYSWNIFLWKYV